MSIYNFFKTFWCRKIAGALYFRIMLCRKTAGTHYLRIIPCRNSAGTLYLRIIHCRRIATTLYCQIKPCRSFAPIKMGSILLSIRPAYLSAYQSLLTKHTAFNAHNRLYISDYFVNVNVTNVGKIN